MATPGGAPPTIPDGLKHMTPAFAFGSKLTAGAVAGIVGVSLTFPLDFAKTRLQKQTTLEYTGIWDCLKKVRAERGALAWYSGIRVNLAGIIPEKAIKLACNDQFREMLRDKETGHVGMGAEILAGAGAGFCQVIVTTPMEIVKIRCQLTGASPVSVIGQLGLKGCYQGYVPTLTRDVWFSLLFFPMQAKLKERFLHAHDSPGEKTLKSFGAGITAGVIASGLSTPVDVIKTRAQAGDGGSMLSVLRATVQNEGYGALWKGLGPRMIAIGPLFGIAVMIYDVQKTLLKKMGYYVPE